MNATDNSANDMEEGGIAMLNTQHDTVVTPDRTKNFGSPGTKKARPVESAVRPLRVLASEKLPKYNRLTDTLSSGTSTCSLFDFFGSLVSFFRSSLPVCLVCTYAPFRSAVLES